MPEIHYIDRHGTVISLDVPSGQSVMRGGVEGGVDGIEAECGGNLACATCHVYVAEEWVDSFPAPEPTEIDMLACAESEVRPTSRLSCQLVISEAHAGLRVHLPDMQS